jgi:hypothetical protein
MGGSAAGDSRVNCGATDVNSYDAGMERVKVSGSCKSNLEAVDFSVISQQLPVCSVSGWKVTCVPEV